MNDIPGSNVPRENVARKGGRPRSFPAGPMHQAASEIIKAKKIAADN